MEKTISFQNAAFYQQNKSEIDEILEGFRRMRTCIISNTLLQITRWDLIEKFYEVSPFVDENEITENTLNLVMRTMDEAKDVLSSKEYTKLESTFKKFAEIRTNCLKMSSSPQR